jgi:hypothetical protein
MEESGVLLKLTNLSDDSPQYFPVGKITGVTSGSHEFEGHACLWLGGADHIVVKESPDEVAELLAKCDERRPDSHNYNVDAELEHFIKLAVKRELPSLDTINGACRLLGLQPQVVDAP